MAASSILKVGRTDAGYVVRVEGRGTLHESPAFLAFVIQTLEGEPDSAVVLDLTPCEYLDSTFLGSLVTLHQKFSKSQPPRFVIAAPPLVREKLLAPTRLDRILVLTDARPACLGEDKWLTLPVTALDQRDFGRHVMECHRRLADLGGPRATAFGQVADQLARELNEGRAS